MEYLERIENNPFEDLFWNIPGMKQGRMNVIGGHGQGFRTPVKTAEFIGANYPLKTVNMVLPDVLQGKVPEMNRGRMGGSGVLGSGAMGGRIKGNALGGGVMGDSIKGGTLGMNRGGTGVEMDNIEVVFVKSTETGSMADGCEIAKILKNGDFNLVIGDLSKNALTLKAVGSACESSDRPLLITRDGVEMMCEGYAEKALLNEKIIWFLSLPQLQKLLRAVYYPKVLTLSQPLVAVAEIIHKVTLSYPCKIVTLVSGQVVVAENGKVWVVPVEKTGYSPFMLWAGELAGKIAVMNLYCPGQFGPATVAALMGAGRP